MAGTLVNNDRKLRGRKTSLHTLWHTFLLQFSKMHSLKGFYQVEIFVPTLVYARPDRTSEKTSGDYQRGIKKTWKQ